MKITTGEMTYSSNEENNVRSELVKLLKNSPLPDDQVLPNLGMFLNSKTLSRILYIYHIYQHIIDHQGVIFDFGTRWGQNMCLFAALRGIYEPFNRQRRIVGFDTFSGFPEKSLSEKDGSSYLMEAGSAHVTDNYVDFLSQVVTCQELDNPMSHIKKHDVVVGDACETVPKYLEDHPHTVVSLAFFDFDLYKPTRDCLEAIKPCLTKGSLLAFDEINDHDSPGETIALKEVFGLENIRLRRYRYCSRNSYFIVE